MRRNDKRPPVTRWWWVRHAPVALGAYLYGHTDLTCDCSDVVTLTALAARLPVEAVVVCSPLSRTRRTLEALLAAGWTVSNSEPLVEAAFLEQAFGAWEGVAWCELQKASNPQYATFWASPFTVRPPGGGENFLDVMTRVREAISRLADKYTGHNIVVIAHAGSIRAALALALDLTPEQVHTVAVDPLSLTRLEHVGAIWRVQEVNAVLSDDRP